MAGTVYSASGKGGKSYLRVQFIDLLDRQLDITRVDGSPYLNPFLDRIKIRLELDIGLDRKFLCSTGVSVGDEVVHNQIVNVSAVHY
jgi:hypothetical protein